MLIADLIAESGEPGILLEDDAKLLDDLPTLEEFRRAKCDILYLGGKPVGDNIVAPQSPWYEPDILWWTIGYVMTPEAAQKLSEYRAAEPLIPADEILPGFYCGKYTSTLPPYVPFPSYRLHAKAVHPWRVEPNNWPSKTDNDDYAFDLRVALFATDPKKSRTHSRKLPRSRIRGGRFGARQKALGYQKAGRFSKAGVVARLSRDSRLEHRRARHRRLRRGAANRSARVAKAVRSAAPPADRVGRDQLLAAQTIGGTI